MAGEDKKISMEKFFSRFKYVENPFGRENGSAEKKEKDETIPIPLTASTSALPLKKVYVRNEEGVDEAGPSNTVVSQPSQTSAPPKVDVRNEEGMDKAGPCNAVISQPSLTSAPSKRRVMEWDPGSTGGNVTATRLKNARLLDLNEPKPKDGRSTPYSMRNRVYPQNKRRECDSDSLKNARLLDLNEPKPKDGRFTPCSIRNRVYPQSKMFPPHGHAMEWDPGWTGRNVTATQIKNARLLDLNEPKPKDGRFTPCSIRNRVYPQSKRFPPHGHAMEWDPGSIGGNVTATRLKNACLLDLNEPKPKYGRSTPYSMRNRVYPQSKRFPPHGHAMEWDPGSIGGNVTATRLKNARLLDLNEPRPKDGRSSKGNVMGQYEVPINEWDNVDASLIPRRLPKPKAKKGRNARFRCPSDGEPSDDDELHVRQWNPGFRSAADCLKDQSAKKRGDEDMASQEERSNSAKRGMDTEEAVRKPFRLPVALNAMDTGAQKSPAKKLELEGVDEKLIDIIKSEMLVRKPIQSWDAVAGLEEAKKTIKNATVNPIKYSRLFQGVRKAPKGILLYGPPGTGKTMLARCVASQVGASFFNIGAASLNSKWVGEGEKLVRTLFAVARTVLPAVIFCDEVDGILRSRSDTGGEHESSRRLKTEFLAQMDGLDGDGGEQLLVLAATNRPSELDDAARRRFGQRIYIGLPDAEAREAMLKAHLGTVTHQLSPEDFTRFANESEGYSGSDIREVCRLAAMGPVEALLEGAEGEETLDEEALAPVSAENVGEAFAAVRPSVHSATLAQYRDFRSTFGTERNK